MVKAKYLKKSWYTMVMMGSMPYFGGVLYKLFDASDISILVISCFIDVAGSVIQKIL